MNVLETRKDTHDLNPEGEKKVGFFWGGGGGKRRKGQHFLQVTFHRLHFNGLKESGFQLEKRLHGTKG